MRIAISALFLVAAGTPAFAQDDGLSGYWKFNIYEGNQPVTYWLVQLTSGKDSKLTATADSLRGMPRARFEELKRDGDLLTFKVTMTEQTEVDIRTVIFDYQGRLPKPGAKKIFGSISVRKGPMLTVVMESTSAKNPFELDRDLLQKNPSDPRAFTTILDIVERAKEHKIEAKELQSLIDATLKSAELYGPKFQARHHARLLGALLTQTAHPEVGAETARKIGKLVNAKLSLEEQSPVLSPVIHLLRRGGAKAEAVALESRLDKLEEQAFAEHNKTKELLNFKVEKYTGRKMKSNRAVLVELFTGAECPPCVAADMAFDGVEKTYGPNEVVLLQYHEHIPRPDPLANEDTALRFDYYIEAYPKKIGGAPTCLFNGKIEGKVGGLRDQAPDRYKDFCDTINKLLETPDSVKLSASASVSGDKISINAKVQGLDKPGEKMRLRIVLVEDWVRYTGGNGMKYHHRVVRAFAGDVKGVAIKDKDFEHKATIDLDQVREGLLKYLGGSFDDRETPLRLRNLSVVAFVQNDETTEVLQAINTPVR